MYQYPSPAPVQAAPQRKRRSGRKAVRRKKKGFALWQWAVLTLLFGALVCAGVQLYMANGSLTSLRQERLAEQERQRKIKRIRLLMEVQKNEH